MIREQSRCNGIWIAAVEANTAGVGSPHALTNPDTGKVWTNEGSGAKNYHTLPAAETPVANRTQAYWFFVQDADGLRVTAAGGDTIRIGANVSAAAGYIESTDIGSAVLLISINATEWVALAVVGTWSVT